MKKNKKFGLIVNFLAASCIVALSGSLYAAEVVINAKIETPKAKAGYVYKVATPRASKEEAVKRCAKIMEVSGVKSFSGDMMKPVEDRMAMYGKEIEVSINNTGTEFFYSNFPSLKLTEKTDRLLSDEKAVTLSLDYLKKTGLMPKNENELKIDHVGGIMQMLSNAKELEKKAVVVYFNRELDGLKVRNFGSSITVTLTDSEIPAGAQYHWREVASKKKVDAKRFLGAKRINALIKEDVNRVFGKTARVVIDKIELVLYDNGGNYIQPAYCYQGVRKAEGKGIADMPVLGYVQALDKVYEPIHHPAYSPKTKKPVTPTTRKEQQPTDEKDE